METLIDISRYYAMRLEHWVKSGSPANTVVVVTGRQYTSPRLGNVTIIWHGTPGKHGKCLAAADGSKVIAVEEGVFQRVTGIELSRSRERIELSQCRAVRSQTKKKRRRRSRSGRTPTDSGLMLGANEYPMPLQRVDPGLLGVRHGAGTGEAIVSREHDVAGESLNAKDLRGLGR